MQQLSIDREAPSDGSVFFPPSNSSSSSTPVTTANCPFHNTHDTRARRSLSWFLITFLFPCSQLCDVSSCRASSEADPELFSSRLVSQREGESLQLIVRALLGRLGLADDSFRSLDSKLAHAALGALDGLEDPVAGGVVP